MVVVAQSAPAQALSRLAHLLNAPLMDIAGTPISFWTIVVITSVVFATLYLSRMVQRAIQAGLKMRGIEDMGTVHMTQRLAHYAVLFLGLTVALQTAGIHVGALFTAGAVLAVGIGFAMQNISQNFVSGIILLTERSIKPGDILEVDGRVLRVLEMRMRSTIARTRDDEDLIIPNSVLVAATVKNLTLLDPTYRVRVLVGVAYGSNLDAVVAALKQAAASIRGKVERDPLIYMLAHGSSSLDFEVSVWMTDPWRAPQMRSDLTMAVNRALVDAGIVIAFPQVDVHFDGPVTEALRARAS